MKQAENPAPLTQGSREVLRITFVHTYNKCSGTASHYLSLSLVAQILNATSQLCPLAFLAASATGGARKPNPSEGAEAAAAARPNYLYLCTETKSPVLLKC